MSRPPTPVPTALLVVAGLQTWLGGGRTSGPATAHYLWVYGSSVLAHAVFFDLPGSAVAGGVLMGAGALPLAGSAMGLAIPWGRDGAVGDSARRPRSAARLRVDRAGSSATGGSGMDSPDTGTRCA